MVSRERPAENRLRISKAEGASFRLEVAMPQDDLVFGVEAPGELVGDVDRAVAPSGAADGHDDGGALVEHEARQPALQESLDVLDQEARLRLALKERGDRRVVAG